MLKFTLGTSTCQQHVPGLTLLGIRVAIRTKDIPTLIFDVAYFRTHGFDSEALKLALSIAVTLRHNQKRDHAQWLNNKENYAKFNCTASGVARKPGHTSYEGWIGHSLNPIGILFNTLVEPCLYPDQDSGRLGHHLDLIPCKNLSNFPLFRKFGEFFHNILGAN